MNGGFDVLLEVGFYFVPLCIQTEFLGKLLSQFILTFWIMQTGNPMLSSSGPSSAPTSQPGNNSQTASNLPQQALPMQAYATQQQLGHLNNMFPYQYIPPNYPQYIHPSYQQNYNQSNNTYAQPTTGSTYPSAVASVKYPLGYKPGTGSGNTPHPSAGAGYGYSAAPSGYSANPSVTAGTASGYDDVGVSQYKDSAVFVPNHQVSSGCTGLLWCGCWGFECDVCISCYWNNHVGVLTNVI